MSIVMYSTENCGYCVKQKEFLEQHNVLFEIRDITKNESYYQEFKQHGGIGTPTTVLKEKEEVQWKVVGFNKKKLSQHLNIT